MFRYNKCIKQEKKYDDKNPLTRMSCAGFQELENLLYYTFIFILPMPMCGLVFRMLLSSIAVCFTCSDRELSGFIIHKAYSISC